MSDIFKDLDFKQLGEEIADDIIASLQGIASGAADDIEAFGKGIARNLIEVAQMPDSPEKELLQKELIAQARLLAEQQRIRINNESWRVFDRVVQTAGNVLITVLRNAAAL